MLGGTQPNNKHKTKGTMYEDTLTLEIADASDGVGFTFNRDFVSRNQTDFHRVGPLGDVASRTLMSIYDPARKGGSMGTRIVSKKPIIVDSLLTGKNIGISISINRPDTAQTVAVEAAVREQLELLLSHPTLLSDVVNHG